MQISLTQGLSTSGNILYSSLRDETQCVFDLSIEISGAKEKGIGLFVRSMKLPEEMMAGTPPLSDPTKRNHLLND